MLLSVLRYALAALGGSGLVADSDLEQVAGAILIAIQIAWSLYEHRQRQIVPPPPLPAPLPFRAPYKPCGKSVQ